MRTDKEQVAQLIEALKEGAEEYYSDQEKNIRDQLISEARKALKGVRKLPSEKLEIPAVKEKMNSIQNVLANLEVESTEKIAEAVREMNLILNEDALLESIEANRSAGKEKNVQASERRLEQLRAPSETMVNLMWEASAQSLQDYDENPLRENVQIIDADVLNEILVALESETNLTDHKEKYVTAIVRDGVQRAVTEKLEVKANLLSDRDYYRREEGFDESMYAGMKSGLILKSKEEEIQRGKADNAQATQKLSGLAAQVGVEANEVSDNMARGKLFRASVALYNAIPMPQPPATTSTSASAKSTPGEIYRLYEACQSPVARQLLTRWDVNPHFSEFYQDQKQKDVSSDFKEALVNHVIQKNKLYEISGPNRYEMMQSVQKGSEGKKEAIVEANSIDAMRKFSDVLLEKVTDLRRENPQACIELLNKLGAAYANVKSTKDFFASPIIRQVVDQLVEINPNLMENSQFCDGLIQFNKMAEIQSQKALDLGEVNNAKLQARTKAYNPLSHSITLQNMGKELGKNYSVTQDTSSTRTTKGQAFFRWLNSPSVLQELKDPLAVAQDQRIPSTIEFKDGSRIRIVMGNLKLEGFPLERLRSFSEAMGVKGLAINSIKTSVENESDHQHFMREMGRSDIPYALPSQFDRLRSTTLSRSMSSLKTSPDRGESRQERRLAKKLSKELIEESFESEKRKSAQISGEIVAGAPRKRTRLGLKASDDSLQSEQKEFRASTVSEEKAKPSPRESDSESVEFSSAQSEESTESPRSESREALTSVKPAVVSFSRQASYSEEEKSESVHFESFIDELELKDRVAQYAKIVSTQKMGSGDRDPSFKEQLSHELTQLQDELLKHSEGGIIDQGLLEATEQKLDRLQKRVNGLVKNENDLDDVVNSQGKVNPVEEGKKRHEVDSAEKGLQNAIDDLREINLSFQERRLERTETQVEAATEAVVQAAVREEAGSKASPEMSDNQQHNEGFDATANEKPTHSPLSQIRGILASVMSSVAGSQLMRFIGDFIQTRKESREDTMSTRPAEETVNFEQMQEEAEDLQAGQPAKEAVLSRESMASAEGVEDQKADQGMKQARQSVAEIEDSSIEDGLSGDEMETVPLLDDAKSPAPNKTNLGSANVSGADSKTSMRGSRAETLRGTEKSAEVKEPGLVAGFLRTIADVWKATTIRLGAGSARTGEAKGVDASSVKSVKAVKAESAGAVANAEFNEVRLLGLRAELTNKKMKVSNVEMKEKLNEWTQGLERQLGKKSGSLEAPPIRFSGGQSIEIKGNDLVLRGFSAEMYQSFNKGVIGNTKLSYRVSAANPDSYNKVNHELGNNGTRSLGSILSSVGLFFQKTWDDAKSFVLGRTSSPEIKPVVDTTRTSSESHTVSNTSPVVDPAKSSRESVVMDRTSSVETGKAAVSERDSTRVIPPLKREDTSSDVNEKLAGIETQIYGDLDSVKKQPDTTIAPDPRRMTVAHTTESSPKTDQSSRRVSAPPTAKGGLGQSWMCVKVTITQQPNFESLIDTLNDYAKAKNLSAVLNSNNENHFSATFNERSPGTGQIKVEASRDGKQVVITELHHSDTSLENMADMVTALPPPGQSKSIVLSGPEGRRSEFNQKVEQSLAKTQGPEKSEPPSPRGSSSD